MKEEHVFLIRMSSIQRKLYSEFMTVLKASGIGSWASSNNPIKAFSVCCKVGMLTVALMFLKGIFLNCKRTVKPSFHYPS